MPILYFPARMGKTYMIAEGDAQDVYVIADNAAYAGNFPNANVGDYTAFVKQIEDTRFGVSNIGAKPYRNSFILVGAGVDRKYFMDDDNLNFNK